MTEDVSAVNVQVNGEPRAVPVGQTLAEWMAGLGLPPQTVLVEYNGQALLRRDWDVTRLQNGDRLEIMQIAAGG